MTENYRQTIVISYSKVVSRPFQLTVQSLPSSYHWVYAKHRFHECTNSSFISLSKLHSFHSIYKLYIKINLQEASCTCCIISVRFFFVSNNKQIHVLISLFLAYTGWFMSYNEPDRFENVIYLTFTKITWYLENVLKK